MNEETAVFIWGKRYSAVRRSGRELGERRVKVGGSMVLVSELADEYDKHHPPEPRVRRPVTTKTFVYSPDQSWDCRGTEVGLTVRCGERVITGLENSRFIQQNIGTAEPGVLVSSPCNRYDVLKGRAFSLVFDKLKEEVSLLRVTVRVGGMTISRESPISGNERRSLEGVGLVQFPFLPFGELWDAWKEYEAKRIPQVREFYDVEV